MPQGLGELLSAWGGASLTWRSPPGPSPLCSSALMCAENCGHAGMPAPSQTKGRVEAVMVETLSSDTAVPVSIESSTLKNVFAINEHRGKEQKVKTWHP